MLQTYFSMRQFRLTKWSFLVHSTTRNAPYIHPRIVAGFAEGEKRTLGSFLTENYR